MMNTSNTQSKVMLPIWLKMFSSKTSVDSPSVLSSADSSPKSILPTESLSKIIEAVMEGKTVILMNEGQPFKVYKEDGKIKVEQLDSFEFK